MASTSARARRVGLSFGRIVDRAGHLACELIQALGQFRDLHGQLRVHVGVNC